MTRAVLTTLGLVGLLALSGGSATSAPNAAAEGRPADHAGARRAARFPRAAGDVHQLCRQHGPSTTQLDAIIEGKVNDVKRQQCQLPPVSPDGPLRVRHLRAREDGAGHRQPGRSRRVDRMHGFRRGLGRPESLQRLHHYGCCDHLRSVPARLRLAQVLSAALRPRSPAPERAVDNPTLPVGPPGASLGSRKDRQSRAGAGLSGPDSL